MPAACPEVVGKGVGGGDDLAPGLDLDRVVAAGGPIPRSVRRARSARLVDCFDYQASFGVRGDTPGDQIVTSQLQAG
jgi:hypothetical protein